VNNILLSRFLVENSFTDVTRDIKTASCFGLVLTCVAALTSFITWAVYHGFLLPLGLEYLQTLAFILIITGFTLVLELVLAKLTPSLHRRVKTVLPLVSTNCAVLGISLIAARSGYTAAESLVAGFSAGAGYFLALLLLAVMRESMKKEWIPRPFRGIPITFISAGLIALAFMAFDEALLKNLIR
jgi:electron transport complex protein RnfA